MKRAFFREVIPNLYQPYTNFQMRSFILCREIKMTATFCGQSGTPGGNRTHNGPLGGGCYIHLTTEACSFPVQ